MSKDRVLNVMVGDLQCIMEYRVEGFQTDQDVPGNVNQFFNELVAAGYTNHLVS